LGSVSLILPSRLWRPSTPLVDIITFDERHFRAMRTGTGETFRLLPADW